MNLLNVRYAAVCGLVILCGSYSVGNEFIKKTPAKIRKEKAQKESLSEQCGRTLDELLTKSFDIQQKIAHFSKIGYQTLRSVACGESCVVDTTDSVGLKSVITHIEQCEKSIKQLEEALEKVERSLSS